tara:strand:- start:1475 stop:1900 length:426 start_codon:yes stop_codon:yes gene_type:complete
MDLFGIGNAIKACAQIYFRSAIQTGRTTALIHSLKAGDRVYFESHQQSRWFESRLKDFGVEGIVCMAWSKRDIGDNFRCGKAEGKAVLDHELIEAMYLKAIDDCSQRIQMIENDLSAKPRAGDAESPETTRILRNQKWWRL